MTIKIRMGMVVFIAIYEQFELNWEKYCLCSFCLANKASSDPSLDLTIKRAKLEHNNVFVKKIVNIIA